MEVKKVLVLSNMYPSEKSKTFGIFVKNQVNAFRKKGLAVDVVAVHNPSMRKADVIRKYLFWLLQTVWNLLTKGKQYDVVHAHYVFPTGMLALLYKRLFKTRFIVTAHGGDIDKMAKKSGRTRDWTKKILHEADHVIAVGHQLHDTIHEEFGVPLNKLSIINMGVNREVFQPMDKTVARELTNIPNDEKAILFVGNLIEQKGLVELLEAFHLLKQTTENVKLYMIGSKKDPSFYERLSKRAEEIGDVSILDAKSQKEIAEWMSASDVFVLPSHIEGFGLVALEAMSCHTPVVGSNVGGLSYLLSEGNGILVEPKNVQSLVEGIQTVLKSAELGKQLIEKGEKQAQENDEKHLIERVLNVYAPSGGRRNETT